MTQNPKEQDYESELADHGVRKYDYDIGRFTSTDVLFEKYYGWSPYQYSANNPINMLDWNGKFTIPKEGSIDPYFGGKVSDYSKVYPSLIKIIDNAKNYLLKDDNMLSVIAKETGVNKDQIINDFTSGKGPLVFVHGAAGDGYHNTDHPGKLWILPHLLQYSNEEKYTKEVREGAALTAFNTIIHEYLHDLGIHEEKEVLRIMAKILPNTETMTEAKKEINEGNIEQIIEVEDTNK